MKCIVKDCINQTHEGLFIGELCAPCHEFLTTGNRVYSQVYKNTQRQWVGLTDIDYAGLPLEQVGLVRWAEAKLRSKNS